MKGVLTLIVFCACLGLGIWGDITLINYITSLVPINEWTGLIKAGLAVATICVTAGVILSVSVITASIVGAFLD